MKLRSVLSVALSAVMGLTGASSVAAKPPKPVIIDGPLPLPVDPGPVDIGSMPPVQVGRLPAVDLAPGQRVNVRQDGFPLRRVIVLQAFLTSNSDPLRTVVPKNMVLRAINLIADRTERTPGFSNCSLLVRLPASGIDPQSTDRIIFTYDYPGGIQASANHTMPFPIRLNAGTALESTLGDIPSSSGAFCQGVLEFIGTTRGRLERRRVR